jgi:hypothetical protein
MKKFTPKGATPASVDGNPSGKKVANSPGKYATQPGHNQLKHRPKESGAKHAHSPPVTPHHVAPSGGAPMTPVAQSGTVRINPTGGTHHPAAPAWTSGGTTGMSGAKNPPKAHSPAHAPHNPPVERQRSTPQVTRGGQALRPNPTNTTRVGMRGRIGKPKHYDGGMRGTVYP